MIPFNWPGTEGKPGGSRLLDDILDRLGVCLGSLAKAVTNERLIFATLDSSPRQVFHGLGAIPVTWEIVGRDAAEVVFEPAIVNGERRKFLYLQASGPVNVTVRFT